MREVTILRKICDSKQRICVAIKKLNFDLSSQKYAIHPMSLPFIEVSSVKHLYS